MTDADMYKERVRQLVAQASALQDEFANGRMPADVAQKISQLLDQAGEFRSRSMLAEAKAETDAYNREPQRKGIDPMFGNAGARSLDESTSGRSSKLWVPNSNPVFLTKSDSVLDYAANRGVNVMDSEMSAGALGCAVKALYNVSDEVENRHFLRDLSTKDMLEANVGAILPTEISSYVVDLLRARSTVFQAGARLVPMSTAQLSFPRMTADPTPTFQSEGATISASDATLDSVVLTARHLRCLVKTSLEAVEDTDPQLLGDVLQQSLAAAFAVVLDGVALTGSGTAPSPRGVANWSGINTLAITGAATWDHLATLAGKLTASNAGLPSAFIWSPRTESAVEVIKASTGGTYLGPAPWIANVPRYSTSAVPINMGGANSEIFAGVFSDLVIGQRLSFQIQRVNDLYIAEGKVALHARLRADVAVLRPLSFAVGTGVSN